MIKSDLRCDLAFGGQQCPITLSKVETTIELFTTCDAKFMLGAENGLQLKLKTTKQFYHRDSRSLKFCANICYFKN